MQRPLSCLSSTMSFSFQFKNATHPPLVAWDPFGILFSSPDFCPSHLQALNNLVFDCWPRPLLVGSSAPNQEELGLRDDKRGFSFQ